MCVCGLSHLCLYPEVSAFPPLARQYHCSLVLLQMDATSEHKCVEHAVHFQLHHSQGAWHSNFRICHPIAYSANIARFSAAQLHMI
jgi:hypothetical protein